MIENIAGAVASGAANAAAWGIMKTLRFVWPLVDGTAYPIALVGGSVSLLLFFGTRDPKYSRFTVVLVLLFLSIKIIGSVIL